MAERWESDVRRTTTRDLMILVVLAGLPLAVAATAVRSDRDPITRAIVAGTSVAVPSLIGLAWAACGRSGPMSPRRGEAFVLIYIALTFVSIVAVVMVFMFDRSMAGLLGLGLFGLLAYFANEI